MLRKTSNYTKICNISPDCTLCIVYKEWYIEEMVNTKFHGLQIDDPLNWKNHIDQMVPKLSGACYAVRVSVPSRCTQNFAFEGAGALILCI
jgi:hypothetical protein